MTRSTHLPWQFWPWAIGAAIFAAAGIWPLCVMYAVVATAVALKGKQA